MNKYRPLIAPFIAVLFILLQTVFGVEVAEDVQSQVVDAIANIIAIGIVVYGIIHNNFEEKRNQKK